MGSSNAEDNAAGSVMVASGPSSLSTSGNLALGSVPAPESGPVLVQTGATSGGNSGVIAIKILFSEFEGKFLLKSREFKTFFYIF